MKSLPTDRTALVQAIAAGRTFSYRLFYGHTPRKDGVISDAVFSQWWLAPFEVDGVWYLTAEHWMMAAKARLFDDTANLARILAASTPSEAKQLGREVRNFDDAVWSQRRSDAV